MPFFPDVTLLITHYNRSASLQRLLSHFEALECRFDDIVVSDDGSRPEHLNDVQSMQSRFQFRLITAPVNKGLGNNINKGQDAVKTRYTLYVQEDFVPQAIFPEVFANAINLLNTNSTFDFVRFYAYFKYPFLNARQNGFSEMVFKWTNPGYRKFYYYSDHPHLRRSTFFEKFGRYPEGIKVEATEYQMMMSVLAKKGKAFFYNDFQSVFEQANSSAEPSTVRRNFWRESENPLIFRIREIYRSVRFNLDYLLAKARN